MRMQVAQRKGNAARSKWMKMTKSQTTEIEPSALISRTRLSAIESWNLFATIVCVFRCVFFDENANKFDMATLYWIEWAKRKATIWPLTSNVTFCTKCIVVRFSVVSDYCWPVQVGWSVGRWFKILADADSNCESENISKDERTEQRPWGIHLTFHR